MATYYTPGPVRNANEDAIEARLEVDEANIEKYGFKPSNDGTADQVLTKTEDGYQWVDAQGGGDVWISAGSQSITKYDMYSKGYYDTLTIQVAGTAVVDGSTTAWGVQARFNVGQTISLMSGKSGSMTSSSIFNMGAYLIKVEPNEVTNTRYTPDGVKIYYMIKDGYSLTSFNVITASAFYDDECRPYSFTIPSLTSTKVTGEIASLRIEYTYSGVTRTIGALIPINEIGSDNKTRAFCSAMITGASGGDKMCTIGVYHDGTKYIFTGLANMSGADYAVVKTYTYNVSITGIM